MADLPSILGGMAQGFLDFGKGAVDLFGTGGAAIADLIQSGGRSTKNQDDFRKWLYETDDKKDAAAKGLGTILNGVQTVTDYIPGIGAVTRNPLFNAGQGALGGIADEFKMYGKDYDLGRAGQRAAVSAGGALAASGLANALKNSGSTVLSSGAAQGLARGATGGAIGAGGYTAIEGGNLSDVLNSATQGAKTGALIGGVTGLAQDLRPAKTYDVALTDDEKAARIANAKQMLETATTPERRAELTDQIKRLGGTPENTLKTGDMAINNAPEGFSYTYDYDGSDMDAVQRAYNLATQDQVKLDGMLKEISDTLGTEFSSAGQKSMESMLNKVERKVRAGKDYTVGSMKDHTRGKIMMNSFSEIPQVLKELDNRGVPYETEVVTNPWGYKGYHITFRNPDGISSEIQLTTAAHWPAKLESDAIYDKWRNFDFGAATEAEQQKYNEAVAKSQALWAKVDFSDFDKTANSLSDTGRASWSVEPSTLKSGLTQEPSLYTKTPLPSESANTSPSSVTQRFSGLGFDKSPNIDTPSNNIIPQNTSRTLEGVLSADDMAVNSPKYLVDENGNPRTFYHGSPNKNITEFDINQAGKNTSSGEHALYFTDSPQVADEFSYERLPSDSMFVDNRGAKGRVYPVNLAMDNPLDLDNLTDAQIRELWEYASPLGQLDGQEKFIKNLTEFRDAAHNGQLTKTLLDLDKLKNSPYDGFTARMYPNQENQAREYAVFDNSKVKMLEGVLANDDMAVNNPKLTPEQEAFFKDSVIRDENGNLIPMYHGTRGNFTVFGDNAPYDTSNSHASVGNWFTPTKEGAKNFAESIWYGDGEPTVMETYLNVKNPKIYETVDNSKAVEALTKELREMELNSSNLSDTALYADDMYKASMVKSWVNDGEKDTAVKWLTDKGYSNERATRLVDEIADLNEQVLKKKSLQDRLSDLKYSDAYQRFKTDIYKMDGQTAEDANVGGIGMALNDRGSIKKYVDKLKSEGYDGIIIKGTRYDADTMGGPNDQYVVFDSNQIKSTSNRRPTSNADIYRALLPFIGLGGLGGGAYMASQQKDKKEAK